MSTKQLCIIVGAILIGAAMIAFGPHYLDTRAQKERDKSSVCVDYRQRNNAAEYMDRNGLPNKEWKKETERRRVAGGCSIALPD
jgi:hypothetical protein